MILIFKSTYSFKNASSLLIEIFYDLNLYARHALNEMNRLIADTEKVSYRLLDLKKLYAKYRQNRLTC